MCACVYAFSARGRVTICEFVSAQYELQVIAQPINVITRCNFAQIAEKFKTRRQWSSPLRHSPGSKLRGESVVADVRWALGSHVEAFMAVTRFFFDGIFCGWQGYGKRAPHLYKYNDGAARWECRDLLSATSMTVAIVLGGRAKSSKETKLIWEVFCLALGWDLHAEHGGEVARHGQGDESR